jgi:hypothetical protein
MSRRVVDELKKLREKDRFVRGLVSWLGFSQTAVDYQRAPRHAGETKYHYRKMIQFAVDGVTSFLDRAAAARDLAGLRGVAARLHLSRQRRRAEDDGHHRPGASPRSWWR